MSNSQSCSKVPGFSVYRVTDGDSVIEKEDEGMIIRRVNPITPPEGLTCIHQQENDVAASFISCDKRSELDGRKISLTVSFKA